MPESDHSRTALTRMIAARHLNRVGGVLQALREVVLEQGHIERADEHVVANVFNLSQAEIRGIVSFYHDLKTSPQPPVTGTSKSIHWPEVSGGRALLWIWSGVVAVDPPPPPHPRTIPKPRATAHTTNALRTTTPVSTPRLGAPIDQAPRRSEARPGRRRASSGRLGPEP